jgi:hypothetical protein
VYNKKVSYGESNVRTSKWIHIDNNWEDVYPEVLNVFTSNAEKLMRKLPTGRYQMIWKHIFGHVFVDRSENGKVSESKFPVGFMIYDNGNIRPINPSNEEEFSTMMIHIYKNEFHANPEDVVRGMISIEDVKNLPEGWEIGFWDSEDAKVLPDIFICNEEGYFFKGKVTLENKEFLKKGKLWYQKFLDKYIEKDPSGTIYTLKDTYRYIVSITGDLILPFIQQDLFRTIITEPYQVLFPENSRIEGAVLKRVDDDGIIITKDDENLKLYKDKIKTLCMFLYKLTGMRYSTSYVQELGVRKDFFNLYII